MAYSEFTFPKLEKDLLLTIEEADLFSVVEPVTIIPQCAAEMYAAQFFNRAKEMEVIYIYGVITTGSSWKVMQLKDDQITVDSQEYFIANADKIMGILIYMVNQSKIGNNA